MNVQIYADWNRFLFESLPQKMKKSCQHSVHLPARKRRMKKTGGGGEGGQGENSMCLHI